MIFPVEIWEKILHKTEALSLTRLRSVNGTFNAIITKHLQKSDAWYRQCEKDIPKMYWFLLLENSFHAVTLEKQFKDKKEYDRYDFKIWVTLYRAWTKWKNVQSYDKYITEDFSPIPEHRLSERITCCSTLGELVAVGSSEGYVRVYNLRTHELVFLVDQYDHAESVKLWVQGKNYDNIILIVTSVYKTVRIWDIVQQNTLISKRPGLVMCAGHSYYCIGLQGKTILARNVASEKNFSVTLVMNYYNSKSNIPTIQCASNNVYPINMTINMNELCCLYNNGLYCEIDLQKVCESNSFYEPQITYLGAPKNQNIRSYHLFNPHVAFCITDRGHLGISVYKSEWQMYNVFPFLEGSISAILFHVSLLVIGLDYGTVCLYSVKDPRGLREINFKKSKKISIANEPIVSINILEIYGDQRLLVTTKQTVYNIKLDYE
ncbi:uncharacterized protein LOC106639691 [Copidosoma floridanum]|uniref:uncharacterized protein LOC106639691 n=1 Tax=Copidosoma floridanum TaxID=29053 RepID=UPI0006C94E2B|nr:uncharacterized protein LOC106639691 [Copidosoma floridanum]